ncbi:MAG: hypothetical protein ACREBO_01230 [Novosphingobium sp.]
MALSHRLIALSIAAVGLATAVQAAAPSASPWYGRWSVAEENPIFTARGLQYKTIDIAPCGNDFCGVSVGAAGACGATLFRFFGHRASADSSLQGHGRWGSGRKNVTIYSYGADADPRGFELYLGDGYDFGGRSENMPKFHADYRRSGAAQCKTR